MIIKYNYQMAKEQTYYFTITDIDVSSVKVLAIYTLHTCCEIVL